MHSIVNAQAILFGLGLLVLHLGFAPTAAALTSVSASPDVTVELDQSGGGTFADEDVAVDDLAGTTLPASLGTLVDSAEVTAYELLAGGDQLFCLATTTQLSATLSVQPADVVRYDGTSYTLELDGSANGIPDGVRCDAVTVDDSGALVLSFDTAVLLFDTGGTSFVAQDHDLVRLDGLMAFSLLFDGAGAGVPERADLDGAHHLAGGDLVVSFDVSGIVGGVDFADEDLLEYAASTTGTWSLALALSTRDSDWIAADADAISVPEPAALLALATGVALLRSLGRRRARRL